MPETIRAIEKKCKSSKRRFEVLLMTDLGDLREGVLPDGIAEAAETLSACEYVSCIGLGTNLGCFGGVLPSRKNMEQLIALSDELRTVLNAQEWIVSGGGSQVYYEMAVSGTDVIPLGITHVRPGGVLLRGKSGADCVPGLRQDTMRIDAEYVEIAKKPSKPFGNIGMDAFGNTPDFEDRGVRMRGIVALGRQDVVIENLKSLRAEVEILGGSSDHMILDIDALGVKPQLGDIESFAIDRYGAMLQAFTSEFVEKRYVRDSGVGFSE